MCEMEKLFYTHLEGAWLFLGQCGTPYASLQGGVDPLRNHRTGLVLV